VLSTNRNDDLVLKTGKYAAAGVEHYWIVDPRDRCLDAYELGPDGVYRSAAHVTPGSTVTIPFGGAGLVTDLEDLLPA
jgi:Uma2 family endonuclease